MSKPNKHSDVTAMQRGEPAERASRHDFVAFSDFMNIFEFKPSRRTN
jgi:hypothetical protein